MHLENIDCYFFYFRYPKLQILLSWKCLFLSIFTPLMIWYTVAAINVRTTPLLETEIKQITVGNIEFDFQTSLYFFKSGNDVYLRGSFPDVLHEKGPPTHCGLFNSSKNLCAMWYSLVKLEVKNSVDEHSSCQRIKWTPTFNHYIPETCFSMAEANWYGGSLLSKQAWPLNKATVPFQSYQTSDLVEYTGESTITGNVLDWFWFSSSGVAVILDSRTPLLISVNESRNNLLCFQASEKVIKPVLEYTVCKTANLRKIQRYLMSKYVQLPNHVPEDSFFLKPSWSTTALFHNVLSQNTLLKYAKDIGDNGFGKCFLEIIDLENSYVKDDVFSTTLFPNSHQMVMYLKEYGFKTYLGVSAFVVSAESTDKSKLLLNKNSLPVKVHWSKEELHILDLRNSETKEWFIEKLTQIKEQYQLDGFSFLGGESNYFSSTVDVPDTNGLENLQEISKYILSVADDLKITPLSSFGYKSQSYSGIVTLSHRHSSWGTKGGLKSVIPSILTLGILGYPFVIPNVIGGLGQYKKVNSSYSILEKPEKELYIRWMELAAFLPVMVFSVPPWYYDDEVMTLAKQLVKLHEEVVAPLVLKASREYESAGNYVLDFGCWVNKLIESFFLSNRCR